MNLEYDKEYRVIVWTRQPSRKFRFANTMGAVLIGILQAFETDAVFYGPTKAGSFMAIPFTNVAYWEIFPLTEFRKVRMSEELFFILGAVAVNWGEPDEEGFYTPTVYRQEGNEKVSTISGPINELEPFEFVNGRALVHPAKRCAGGGCPIHHPSEHLMVDWPMLLRETALVERLCPHRVGHPDPDSAKFLNRRDRTDVWGIHGCDGCCHP